MSADLLRRAAAAIRVNAKAVEGDGMQWWSVDSFAEVTNYDDAEHFVAFGRPAVALAVADWLDAVAEAWPVSEPDYWSTARAEAIGHRQALTVARAYLGSDA